MLASHDRLRSTELPVKKMPHSLMVEFNALPYHRSASTQSMDSMDDSLNVQLWQIDQHLDEMRQEFQHPKGENMVNPTSS